MDVCVCVGFSSFFAGCFRLFNDQGELVQWFVESIYNHVISRLSFSFVCVCVMQV